MKSSHSAAQHSLGQYDLYFPDLSSAVTTGSLSHSTSNTAPNAPPVPTASVSKLLHLMFLVLEVVSTRLLYFI